VPQLYRSCLL